MADGGSAGDRKGRLWMVAFFLIVTFLFTMWLIGR
jgi:hypothetical protein